ncbi:MAG TPA: hypothetical protein VFC78_01785 [Tepidisphaeraceae bacterium]|nr:hypothetical protein [Tepidisphaeraceae bacterium]
MNLRQRIDERLAEATRQLREGEAKFLEIQNSNAKLRIEIQICTELLGSSDAEGSSQSEKEPSSANGDAAAGLRDTARDIFAVMNQSLGPFTLAEIVQKITRNGNVDMGADNLKVKNKIASVLYRAAKNPRHPVFRKAGMGTFNLAPEARHQ